MTNDQLGVLRIIYPIALPNAYPFIDVGVGGVLSLAKEPKRFPKS